MLRSELTGPGSLEEAGLLAWVGFVAGFLSQFPIVRVFVAGVGRPILDLELALGGEG